MSNYVAQSVTLDPSFSVGGEGKLVMVRIAEDDEPYVLLNFSDRSVDFARGQFDDLAPGLYEYSEAEGLRSIPAQLTLKFHYGFYTYRMWHSHVEGWSISAGFDTKEKAEAAMADALERIDDSDSDFYRDESVYGVVTVEQLVHSGT